MFGKGKTKNDKKPTRQSGAGNDFLKGLGLDIPNFDDPNNVDMDDDDEDYEAELRALQGETTSPASKRAKPKAQQATKPGEVQDLQAFHKDVNKLLNDIERPMNDDELSDTDEAALMAELGELVDDCDDGDAEAMPIPQETRKPKAPTSSSDNPMISLLQEREQMYIKAVATAKTAQESTKVRRFERQLKMIQDFIQSARAGAKINEDEIPPALFVAAPTSQSEPVVQAPPPPLPPRPVEKSVPPKNSDLSSASVGSSSEQAIARLKALALQARAAGDMDKAREYLIELKKLQGVTTTTTTTHAPAAPPAAPPVVAESQSDAVALPLKAPVPTTVLEALQQRYEELAKRHQEALKSNESAKARRFDRQVKQYQEAIDAAKKNRPFDYSELPELPGFAPIPMQQAKAPAAPAPAAVPEARPVPPPPVPASVIQRPAAAAAAGTPQIPDGTGTNSDIQSLRLKREQMHKLAVQAKDRHDLEAARKYISLIKAMDEKIKKAESISTISTSQYSSTASLPTSGFEVIRDDEFTEELARCDPDKIHEQLKNDLLQQIQLCARNQQMYAQMEGAINAKYANDFKALEQRSIHDLEQLKQSQQKRSKVPVFHYEKRQLNLIQSNNDLTENELEVTVIRGINLPIPSGYTAETLETYVTLDFPYPSESSQTARTRHGTGTSMVEYPDARFRFTIKRSDTKLRRLFVRKELRLNIFYKAGFLRADRQLGVAALKLAALETCATVHDSVDIYENDHRKKVQGKLEVKIRIREALGPTKAADLTSHRWLVIDRFDDIPQAKKASISKSTDNGFVNAAAAAPPNTLSPVTNALASLVTKGPLLDLLAINLAGNSKNNDDNDKLGEESPSSSNNLKETATKRSLPPNPVNTPVSIQVVKYEAQLIQEQIDKLENTLDPEIIENLKMKQTALREQAAAILAKLENGGKAAIDEHIDGLKVLAEQYKRDAAQCQQDNEKKAEVLLSKRKRVKDEIKMLSNQVPDTQSEADSNSF